VKSRWRAGSPAIKTHADNTGNRNVERIGSF
jgi:hypothetical protein